jgi:MFS transporter, OPA family, glycerol-3-phosphate transporter
MTTTTQNDARIGSDPSAVGFRPRRGMNWGMIGLMYAAYYMCRYNFRFATPGMVEDLGFDRNDIAQIFAIWSLAYGTGQLVNGLFSDRLGGRTIMFIGAVGTIIANFIFGFSMWVSSVSTFGLIALLNAWFQSMGAPGMVKMNAAWFNRNERGTFSGIFGIMIQLGQFSINNWAPLILAGFNLSLFGLALTSEAGNWRMLFILPPLVTAGVALLMISIVKEEPAAANFPEAVEDEFDNSVGTRVTIKESFSTIFRHPLVWFYAVAYGSTGAVRHSSDQLSILYFEDQLGLDLASRPLPILITMNLMPLAAILGSIGAGWVSDRFFRGQRSPVAMSLYFTEAAVLSVAAMVMYFGLVGPSPMGIFLGCLFLVLTSLTVNSTHSIVGAAAPMDIGGKKFAGFAAGVIDSFQYYGAALGFMITGPLLNREGGWVYWYPVMVGFAACGGISMLLVTLKQKRMKKNA